MVDFFEDAGTKRLNLHPTPLLSKHIKAMTVNTHGPQELSRLKREIGKVLS